MIRERYQNPVLGDTLQLRNVVYSSNTRANVHEVNGVSIYYLDQEQKTGQNPEGRVLISSIVPSAVSNPSTGEYLVSLETNEIDFRIGSYIDRWDMLFEEEDQRSGIVEHNFNIYKDLWYTSPIPLVHNIGFNYSPHKILSGSKKYVRVDLEIYLPDATSMENFYYYLATIADVQMKMSQDEGEGYDPDVSCNNVIFNWQTLTFRERTTGYYLLDTTIDPRPHRNGEPLPDGIYLVQFKATLGETIHLSPQYRLQIFS